MPQIISQHYLSTYPYDCSPVRQAYPGTVPGYWLLVAGHNRYISADNYRTYLAGTRAGTRTHKYKVPERYLLLLLVCTRNGTSSNNNLIIILFTLSSPRYLRYQPHPGPPAWFRDPAGTVLAARGALSAPSATRPVPR